MAGGGGGTSGGSGGVDVGGGRGDDDAIADVAGIHQEGAEEREGGEGLRISERVSETGSKPSGLWAPSGATKVLCDFVRPRPASTFGCFGAQIWREKGRGVEVSDLTLTKGWNCRRQLLLRSAAK